MKVKSRQEAWNKVNRMIDWDYLKDSQASHNAGYPIYRSAREGHDAWISDLGTSLEVNTPDGKTTRIVIDEEIHHHFEISIRTERFNFTTMMSTAYEAYQAIEDVVNKFNLNVNMDKMMETLVTMKNENLITTEDKWFRISYQEGEV